MATILVVDDRSSNRQVLSALLGYFGHRVLEATNGAEALELVRTDPPELIITDILMPVVDGFELTQRLRADPAFAKTPVIFHTATFSEPEAHRLAESCGVRTVLPKPCEPQQVLDAVSRELGIDLPSSLPPSMEANFSLEDTITLYAESLDEVKRSFDYIASRSVGAGDNSGNLRQLSKKVAKSVAELQRIGSRVMGLVEVALELTPERDPARLVKLFFGACCEAIDSRYAAIGVYDERDALLHVHTRNVETALLEPAPGALLESLRQTRTVRRMHIDGESAIVGLPPGHPPVRSFLGLPIATASRVYGWLYFAERRGADAFDDEDQRLGSIFAAKLAVLYENAILYDEIQRHAADLRIEVAERRRAEAELRHFRLALDNSADIILITDRRTMRHVDANNTACQLLGYSRDELLRMGPADLLPHGSEHVETAFDALIAAPDRPASVQSYYRCKNGSRLPFEATRHALNSDDAQLVVWISRDIRERLEADRALQESEAGLRHAQSMAKLAHAITRPDGSTERCSDTLATLTGVDSTRIRSTRDWLSCVHPRDRSQVRTMLLKSSSAPGRWELEYRLLRPDGMTVAVRQTSEPLPGAPDEHGRFRWFNTVQDVTEQKRTETDLRESELRFRELAENIGEVFWLTDPEKNQILYVSPAYDRIWGRSRQSVYGAARAWVDAIHPEDRARVLQAARTKQVAGEYAEEYRIVRPDGTVRWIRDRAFPVYRNGKDVYRVAGIAEDITEQRRRADELRESERRFSDMLGKVQLISVMLDREARITYCNDYFLRLTGWTRPEVEGRTLFATFVPESLQAEVRAIFAGLMAEDPSAWHHENEIVTRFGNRRLVRWNNSVLRSASGEVIGTASIGEDITEQRQAETKVRRLNRVYAVLSGINTLIVRARDRHAIYQESCRIAVEAGSFRMALLMAIDRESGELRPVASYGGPNGMLEAVLATAGGDERFGPFWQAILDKRPVVANDLRPNTESSLNRARLQSGIQSFAVLPLVVDGEGVAALALYAAETAFFDDEEMKLLLELSGDISFALEHIKKAEQVNYLAFYDSLTGLGNRALFHEHLAHHLSTAKAKQQRLALALIDVARFKIYNDTFGRRAGDALLKQVAERMLRFTNDPARVARVGGDHFAILVDVHNEEDLARLLESAMEQFFRLPFSRDSSQMRISGRAGIALYPDDAADAEALFTHAEAALKKAKQSGEQQVFYTQQITDRIAEKLLLENQLRQALERQEFVLHYQPKIDLKSGRIAGVEALIRWHSPERGLVPPTQFIPLLEETGLILQIGTWALKRAARDHRGWVESGLRAPRVAVNVSALQLRQSNFVKLLEHALMDDVQPTGVDLEITESLIMEDVEDNIEKLNAAQKLGVTIAIDDFGTGYSSLGYLAKLPVQTLKIDRSFIVTMQDDADAMTLVSMIISLAHSLGLAVVAEGVESEEQAKFLRLLKCDQAQGYLFSRPIPHDELVAMLQKDRDAAAS